MTGLQIAPPAQIAVLGGSGFLGQTLARALVGAGFSVKVLTRRTTPVADLAVLPQVQTVSVPDPADVAALTEALRGCAAVVNLVGILHESARTGFAEAHVGLVQSVIEACARADIARLVQVSALGAAAQAPSRYLRSKAEAEALVTASSLSATILRPSVIFGREDRFLNLFAGLARMLPVLVLACPDAKFQPIHVEDVAHAIVACLEIPETIGQTLELGGPEVLTLRQLIDKVGVWTKVRRPVIGLGVGLSLLQASLLELLPVKLMTRDNVRSMQVPNVCSGPFPAVLGFLPVTLESVVPAYLAPQRGRARYGDLRQRAGR